MIHIRIHKIDRGMDLMIDYLDKKKVKRLLLLVHLLMFGVGVGMEQEIWKDLM